MSIPRIIPALLLVVALGFLAFLLLAPTQDHPLVEAPAPATQSEDMNGSPPAEVLSGDLERADLDAVERQLDRRGLQPTVSEQKRFSITVQRSDGSPVSNARILPWAGDKVMESSVTNSIGVAILKGWDGQGGLFVTVANHYPALFPLPKLGEDQVVVLPEGRSLEGNVILRSPWQHPEPLQLKLESLPDDLARGLPHDIQMDDALYDHLMTVEQDGGFRIRGLPDDWKGHLYMPKDLVLCSYLGPGEQNRWKGVRNLHASRGLQLELTPMRSITGRVVTPDGKAGIANVSMIVTIALTEELDDWRSLSVVSEDGGRFRIPFPVQTALEAAAVCAGESDRHPFSIQMNLLGTDHYSGAEVEMDLTSLEDPWVVGDIPVAERSILSLRVLTQTGEPIAGAVAEGNAISEPTDVEGRTLVSLPNGEQQIPVMAAGYRTTMTDPIPPGQASAEVVLAPTNRLTVRFQLPESVDRSSWKLRLMSEGEVFEEGNRFFKAGSMRRRLGVLMSQGGGKKGGGKYAQFHLPEEADVLEIWGLEPRVPITCAIADEFGQSFVSSTPVVLGDATHLELNLVSPFPPRHLQGRVVDGSGVPLPGAHVMVWGSANTGRGDVTDKEGRFDFGAIAVESIFLDVKAEGYGTYRKEALLLPTEGDEIRIVLREPREVVIRVSDPFGNRVDGTDLRFGVSHEIDYPVQEEVGVFRFASLPQDDCEIQWTIGGQSGSLFLEEGVQEYDLVVPAMGSLRVHLTTTPSQDKRRYRLVLEPTDAAATEGYDPNRGLHLAAEATAIRKTFAQQLPGQYRATLLIWVKEDGRYTFQSIADLGEVQVAPDIETELSGSF